MSDALKSLTSADLADLKAKAKAATPGRWVVYNETDVWTVDDKPIACTDFGDVTEFAKNNVAHIAAANPETILRLIAMIERRDAWRTDFANAKHGGDVLLYYGTLSGLWPKQIIGYWRDGHWVWQSRACRGHSEEPTAWQPLPAPPSEALSTTEPQT